VTVRSTDCTSREVNRLSVLCKTVSLYACLHTYFSNELLFTIYVYFTFDSVSGIIKLLLRIKTVYSKRSYVLIANEEYLK